MGIGRGSVDARIERGLLHVVHRGTYSVGHRLLDRNGRWMAAVLACGPGAVLARRSAGQLWHLVPAYSGFPEVIRRTSSHHPRVRVFRVSLREDEVAVIEGIPVTSVFRTMLDLAAVLKPRELERAWNEMKVRDLTDRLSMAELLARHRGRRGTVALRALVGSTAPEGITRNKFEERFVALLDVHGLPRPRLNATLSLRGRFYEIDCLWPSQRLAFELDSREVHATDRAFESDRQRDRVLLAEGYRTGRVTWRQLRDEPAAVAADLRRALSG